MVGKQEQTYKHAETKRTSEKGTRPESRRDNNNNKHLSATWAQSAEPFRLPSRSACPPVFLMLLYIELSPKTDHQLGASMVRPGWMDRYAGLHRRQKSTMELQGRSDGSERLACGLGPVLFLCTFSILGVACFWDLGSGREGGVRSGEEGCCGWYFTSYGIDQVSAPMCSF